MKRRYGWSESKIKRYINEGRGKGEFEKYKPWIKVQNLSSLGRSHRKKGWKTKRNHEFFSDMERNYFFLLEWADEVIDIREQFPLERESTLDIANKIKVKHPVDNNIPVVMTTDFLITLKKKEKSYIIARSIKYSEELDDLRTIEKLAIEQEYWNYQGIDWGIVTEKNVNDKLCSNISWMHKAYHIGLDEIELSKYLLAFSSQSLPHQSIGQVIFDFEKLHNLKPGTGLWLFKHLCAKKNITFNMEEEIFSIKLLIEQLTFNGIGEDLDNDTIVS